MKNIPPTLNCETHLMSNRFSEQQQFYNEVAGAVQDSNPKLVGWLLESEATLKHYAGLAVLFYCFNIGKFAFHCNRLSICTSK